MSPDRAADAPATHDGVAPAGAERPRRARRAGGGRLRLPRRPPGMREVPLSFMQEQLWFLDQANPGLTAYNIPVEIHVRGELQPPALRRAMADVCARHEILRARYVTFDGRPYQRFASSAEVGWTQADWSELSHGEREERLAAERRRVADHAFDLERDPPVVASLVRTGAQAWALLITFHHIAFDGGSYPLFLRDLWACYSARLVGGAVPDRLAIGYGDFALWQREQLQGARLQGVVDFWRERLAGELPVTVVPTDAERPPVQTYNGLLVRHSWPQELADRVERFAAEHDTTPFAVLLTACFAVLHRYTGQDDLIVGIPSSNRELPELAKVIGFFVNMLPIRTGFGDDPGFETALARVTEALVTAQGNATLPFAKLVEIIQPERDPSRLPIFQTAFAYADNRDLEIPACAGITAIDDVTPGDGPRQPRFDIGVTFERQHERMVLHLEFNTDLYSADKVRRLAGHLEALLSGALEAPATPVSRLPLLTSSEWQQLVVDYNRTAAPVPADRCVHEVVEARSREHPEHVAVADERTELTFGQLNRQANRLARNLVARGIGCEDLVGISMRRGVPRLVAVLAVLKAGAGYVPIDPAYPAERIRFMIDDSRIRFLVADQETPGGVTTPTLETIDVDGLDGALRDLDDNDLPRRVEPGGVAYVIYTSGSTGTPKGVVIEHRALVNFMTSTRRLFALTPADRVLQFASLSFDVSVFEMFAGLGAGATVVIPSEETVLSPVRLTSFLAEQRISVTDIPPAVMALLDPSRLTDLRIVFVGGEAFSAGLVMSWSAPGRRFFNGYGPTETTVTVVARELDGSVQGNPPMGAPMDNHVAYVVDRYLNPLPVGIPGELLIGGAGLARGYLRRPDLTAQRFVPAPVAGTWPRVYRTGDLARFVDAHDLEFVGRLDDQVKVRGYRVELGEVTARLKELDGVRDAVVRVRRDGEGKGRDLVAYWIAAPDAPVTADDLRPALAERLPGFMVPSHFVQLDAFPLTGSGKVDERALPEPQQEPDEGHDGPRGAVADYLAAEVFAPILGQEAVPADTSFFRLGGTSLQAMQVLSRLRQELGLDVDVRDLFQHASVTAFADVLQARYGVTAEAVEELGGAEPVGAELYDEELEQVLAEDAAPEPATQRPQVGAGGPVVVLAERGGRVAVAGVHPVAGSVAPYVPLAERLGAYVDVYGLQSPPIAEQRRLAPDAGRLSIEDTAALYLDALERRLGTVPRAMFGWSLGGMVAYEMGRQLAERVADVRVALLDTSPPGEPGDYSDDALIVAFARDAAASLGLPEPDLPAGFGELSRGAKLRALVAQLARHSGGAWLNDAEERFAVFRANALASRTYAPGPTRANLLVLHAEKSDHEPGQWRPYATGGWRYERIPGDHYDVVQPAATDTICACLLRHYGVGTGPRSSSDG